MTAPSSLKSNPKRVSTYLTSLNMHPDAQSAYKQRLLAVEEAAAADKAEALQQVLPSTLLLVRYSSRCSRCSLVRYS